MTRSNKNTDTPIPENLVLVEWFDSCGPMENESFSKEDAAAMKPMEMFDLGILVEENDKCIVVAGNVSEIDIYRRLICIPKVNIIRLLRLGIKHAR